MTLLNTISNLAYAASRAVLLYALDWLTFSKCVAPHANANATAGAAPAPSPADAHTGGSLFNCYTNTMKQV